MYDLMCIRYVIYYLNRIYKDLNPCVHVRGKNATVGSSLKGEQVKVSVVYVVIYSNTRSIRRYPFLSFKRYQL